MGYRELLDYMDKKLPDPSPTRFVTVVVGRYPNEVRHHATIGAARGSITQTKTVKGWGLYCSTRGGPWQMVEWGDGSDDE